MSFDLTMERVCAADPETVWRAFTEPAALAAWFWPFPATAVIDPAPGGAFAIAATNPAMAATGTFTTAEPPRAFATTWHWDGEDVWTDLAVSFTPTARGTTVTVTHSGFVTDQERDEHVQGWSDCLDRLPRYLDSRR